MNDLDIRGVFEPLLYDEVVDEYELELLSFRQFKDFSSALFGVNPEEMKAISAFVQDYFIGESLDFKLLELIFTKMGIVDPKKDLSDPKAKRIVSRINMKLNKKTLNEFFNPFVKEQKVLNKTTG